MASLRYISHHAHNFGRLSPVALTDQDPTLTSPSAIQQELRHVRALMQLEQKEDQAQFKLKNTDASIKERRKRGLTWGLLVFSAISDGTQS